MDRSRDCAFLAGGGEIGALIRAHDWSATKLGSPETWSASLRTALAMVLKNPFPMVLAWGPELITFHNDAYRRLLGDKRDAVGRPFLDIWPEFQGRLRPLFEQALAGAACFFEDAPFELLRHDRLEETFFDFTLSPVRDETGLIVAVLNVVIETTGRVLAERRAIAERERLARMFEQAPGFMAMLDGPEHRIALANQAYMRLVGHRDVLGKTVVEALPDAVAQGYLDLLDQVYGSGEAYSSTGAQYAVQATPGGPVDRRSVDFVFQPVTDAEGRVTGIFVEGVDVTARERAGAALRASEALYRQIVEGADDFAIITQDGAGIVASWNAGAERLLGYPEDEVIGRSADVFFKPEDRERGAPDHEMSRAHSDGRAVNERWHMRKDGSRFWGSGLMMRLDQGGGFLKMFRDRTAEHAAEARRGARADLADALRDLQDPTEITFAAAGTLGRTLGASRVGYAAIDHDAETLNVERDWTAPGVGTLAGVLSLRDDGSFIDGLKRGELTVVRDVRDDARAAGPAADALDNRSARAFVNVPIVEQGRLTAVFFVNHADVREWAEGDLALIKEFADRTRAAVERARGERALRLSEERYRTLFESIESGFCVVEVNPDARDRRIDYRVVEANPAFYRQTGFPEAILGQWLREAAPALEDHWFETYGRVASTGSPERFEQGSDALGRWFDGYAFRVGERRVAILFNDISARRTAENALRELNETLERQVADRTAELRRFRDIVEATASPICAFNHDYRLIAFNKAHNDEFRRVNGYDTKLGDVFPDLFIPEQQPVMRALMARALTGERFIVTEEFGRPEFGQPLWEISYTPLRDERGAIVGAFHLATDISNRLRAEAELAAAQEALRQSQKMEAMGQLTGGVAHDFNNLLTPIVGSLDMLQRKGLGGEREQRLIAGAAQSADRARVLVQRLLAFARRQPLQPVAVDIARLVTGMADLVASTTGPQIKVVVDVADDLSPAKADPNQLEMALLNLAVNARDAMPDGGTLRISASADRVPTGAVSTLRPGRYVRVSVADTGTGMDEATLARAIEPFFSTKGVGKGTGLGLSMVHGLASQLGGELTIKSRRGLGTNVELWLPQTEQTPEPSAVTREAELARGIGTALLVDDEDIVRLSTAAMLADLGYRVLEAASAEEALRIIEDGAPIDFLVTDHLMPGMTGTDLARLVRVGWPGMPVLVVSGYAEVDGVDADLPRLTKPFREDELATSLAGLFSPR